MKFYYFSMFISFNESSFVEILNAKTTFECVLLLKRFDTKISKIIVRNRLRKF